jgi:hypothetical protein
MRRLGALLVLLWAMAPGAQAHVASNGFLRLDVQGSEASGALELAVRDGELAVGLDRNGDGRVTWGELRAQQAALAGYVRTHLMLSAGDRPCELTTGELEVNERVDGNYLWLPLVARCAGAVRTLRIDYRLLQAEDPSHRGLLTLTAGGLAQTAVLGGSASSQTFQLSGHSVLRTFLQYAQAGVWHIWSGIDHLLFLLSLLLPAVLIRRNDHWEAVPLAGPALLNIVKVVTAFTLAHSITLTLAALQLVHLPGRLTESAIAASIIVAALNNVFPRVTQGRWRIAFAFGLLHGFGFASVLSEMGLPTGARLVSLVGFNLGVEAGQLVVVLAVMPLAFVCRATTFYRRAVLPWGSTAIAALAAVWLVQRATG